MGHSWFGFTFDHFIHAFHMPMFFFISGYFYKEVNQNIAVLQYIRKKTRALLVPYIIFGGFHYILYAVLSQNIQKEKLISVLFFNDAGLPIAGALWFLTVLFFTEIIYFCIRRLFRNQYVFTLIILCVTLLGVYYETIMLITLPWSIHISLVGVGLYHLGYLMKCNHEVAFIQKILNLNMKENVLLVILVTFLIFQNGYINMRLSIYSNVFLFWFNAILSCVILINLSRIMYLHQILGTKLIQYIGENAILYVCMNQLVIRVIYELLTYVYIPEIIQAVIKVTFGAVTLLN